MIIIVTGTPGTGKTTVSKKISKKYNHKYLNVNPIITKNKLSVGYDKKLKTKIINTKKLNKELIKVIKKEKNLVIDSHLSHYLPKKYVDLCIITKCDIKKLKQRLKKRKYNKIKTEQNMQAEILDICLIEAIENKHKIKIINTNTLKNINKEVDNLKIK